MSRDRLIDILDNKDILNIDFSGDKYFSFGDIVLAKRYDNNGDKKKLRVGHRDGYYLILQALNGEYLALYGTSDFPTGMDQEMYFTLNKKDSNLESDIYFLLEKSRLLKSHLIRNKVLSIDDNFGYKIQNRVRYYIEDEKIRKKANEELDRYPLIPGDVFTYNNCDYIYVEGNEDTIFVLPVLDSGEFKVSYNGKIGYVNFADASTFPRIEMYHRVGYVVGKQFDYLVDRVKRDYHFDRHINQLEEVSKRKNLLLRSRNEKKNSIPYDHVLNEIDDLDYIGMVVEFLIDDKEYIVLFKNEDCIVMIDKEMYISGDYSLCVTSTDQVIKKCYISNKSLYDLLSSLQDMYSSYLAKDYIKSLRIELEGK